MKGKLNYFLKSMIQLRRKKKIPSFNASMKNMKVTRYIQCFKYIVTPVLGQLSSSLSKFRHPIGESHELYPIFRMLLRK